VYVLLKMNVRVQASREGESIASPLGKNHRTRFFTSKTRLSPKFGGIQSISLSAVKLNFSYDRLCTYAVGRT
jgi:hypothetical protein